MGGNYARYWRQIRIAHEEHERDPLCERRSRRKKRKPRTMRSRAWRRRCSDFWERGVDAGGAIGISDSWISVWKKVQGTPRLVIRTHHRNLRPAFFVPAPTRAKIF